MAEHPDRDPFGVDPHHNRDWWARSPDDRRGDYPGPDHPDDEKTRDDPRNSSRFPSPPADETYDYCEGCGRPMEAGGAAYCDACTARGRHRGEIQEDQLDEPRRQGAQSASERPDHLAPDSTQPTALAEHHQAIAYGIDPAVLAADAADTTHHDWRVPVQFA